MKFEVRARAADGVARSFTREADDRAALLSDLKREGYVVLGVSEISSASELPPWWDIRWLKPMTGFDVEMGLRQLASMLRSGVTLLAALRITAEQATGPRAAKCWKEIGDKVMKGGSFEQALASRTDVFTGVTVRLAGIGEKTGEMEKAVTRSAEQLEARRNLRMQVVNALVYPLLAVVMAIGVSVFLVTAVIPKIGKFLEAGGAELPAITRMLMDTADWFDANGLKLAVYLAAAIAAWCVVRRNGKGREWEDAFLMKVPVTGKILRLSGTALFARSMQIMTESGVTLIDALATAEELTGNRRLRRRIENARKAVTGGASLSAGLSEAREFTVMLRKSAVVAEVTGALPETFGGSAKYHEMTLAIAVKRFGMMIEPVMIIVTGGLVGFVYIAFFMAIFAIAGAG